MNRILLYPSERLPDPQRARFEVRGDRARHVFTTLHGAPGKALKVGVLDGALGIGTVRECSLEHCEFEVEFDRTQLPRPVIDLIVALPRPKALKRLLPQIAACGVDRLLLVNAARVEKPYFSTQYLEPEHYEPLLDDGLMQGGHTHRPRLEVERRFRPFVEDRLADWCGDALRFVCDPAATADELPAIGSRRVVIAIGPDTGFVPFERECLAAQSFLPLRLGGTTLRVDTACIAALAAIEVLRRVSVGVSA